MTETKCIEKYIHQKGVSATCFNIEQYTFSHNMQQQFTIFLWVWEQTVMVVRFDVLWKMTSDNFVNRYECFGGTHCLHPQYRTHWERRRNVPPNIKCLFAELQEVTPRNLLQNINFYSRYSFEWSSIRVLFSSFHVQSERNALWFDVIYRQNTVYDTMCFLAGGNWIL